MYTTEYLATLSDKVLVYIINYLETAMRWEWEHSNEQYTPAYDVIADLLTEVKATLYQRDDTWDNGVDCAIDF